MSGTLNYWSSGGGEPPRALPSPLRAAAGSGERVDWLTMAVVVCVAAGGAFSVVIAIAWVMGG